MTNLLVAGIAVLLSAVLFNCAGIAPANQTGAVTRQTYFTGDGGKGRSITILPPRSVGLAQNQGYLPDLVACELVSNFSSFSAMTLFDRVNNQRQYDELLSGLYADDDAAGLDLGHLESTDYMLLGTITRTSTGYVLQLTVNSNSNKTTVAAYSGTVSIAELDDLTGVRRASLDLLVKMGVQVTERTRTELTVAAAANRVNAQTAQAQGIVAQRQGNRMEAMMRFYEAASYDPSLTEAVTRANTMSATVRTGRLGGNIRENIRSEIARRDEDNAWRIEWEGILAEGRRYLRANPPVMARIIYNPNLKPGKIDYDTRTAELTFSLGIMGVSFPPAVIRMIGDLNAGVRATGRNLDWELDLLNPQDIWEDYFTVRFRAELLNDAGQVIDSDTDYFALYINQTGTSRNGDIFKLGFTVGADRISDTMTVRIDCRTDYPVQVTTGSVSRIRTQKNTREYWESSIFFADGLFSDGDSCEVFGLQRYWSPFPFTSVGIGIGIGSGDIEHGEIWYDAGHRYYREFSYGKTVKTQGSFSSIATMAGLVYPIFNSEDFSGQIFADLILEMGMFGDMRGMITDWLTPGFDLGVVVINDFYESIRLGFSLKYKGMWYQNNYINFIGIGFIIDLSTDGMRVN
jgi:hypothetical protein